MKNWFSSVAAQGAGAEKGMLLPKSNVFSTVTPSFQGRLQPLSRWGLLVGLLVFCSGISFGQTNDTLYGPEFNYRITAPNQILSEGESVVVSIEAGGPDENIANAIEVDLEVIFSNDVVFPVTPQTDLSNSWFFGSSQPDTVMELDVNAREFRLQGTRSPSQTGQGVVYELTVTAAENGVNANTLVTTGGGIVVLEDMGFKWQSGPENASGSLKTPILYPNPCRDVLNFDWQGDPPSQIVCRNRQGQLVKEVSAGVLTGGKWATDDLPPGLYFLSVFYQDKAPVTLKFVKQ